MRAGRDSFIDKVRALCRREAVDGRNVIWWRVTDGAIHEQPLHLVVRVSLQVRVRRNRMVVVTRDSAFERDPLQFERDLWIAERSHDVIREVGGYPEAMAATVCIV